MNEVLAMLQLEDSFIYQAGLKEGRDEGIGRGKAQLLLRVLQARGLLVGDDVRQRILSCSDSTQLDLWADRAVTVTRAEDIFATA